MGFGLGIGKDSFVYGHHLNVYSKFDFYHEGV